MSVRRGIRLTLRDSRSGDSGEGPAMACLKPLRLLLADDYEANRMLQLAQLEELGYPTDTVANGEEVIRALSARDYDVVLLDISMPVMDGLATARRIRERRQGPQPYLVAVTANTAAHDRARIQSAGFDAHIAKPAAVQDFATVLDRAYSRLHGKSSGVPPATAKDEGLSPGSGAEAMAFAAVNEILLRRVMPIYLRELPVRVDALRAAFFARDPASLARLCHALKGAGRILSATPLAEACERMEQQAYEGRLPDAGALDELIDMATRTGQDLRRKLAAG